MPPDSNLKERGQLALLLLLLPMIIQLFGLKRELLGHRQYSWRWNYQFSKRLRRHQLHSQAAAIKA